ncbi:hypothetical protein [Scytonema hofmannii]|uniref:hypothetical protein n=1 Tax=Scytonema hofmannii TaxID=34078 RepID=UPI0011DFC96E|nr:hypothetical protein [Scytonema hofmannii]
MTVSWGTLDEVGASVKRQSVKQERLQRPMPGNSERRGHGALLYLLELWQLSREKGKRKGS